MAKTKKQKTCRDFYSPDFQPELTEARVVAAVKKTFAENAGLKPIGFMGAITFQDTQDGVLGATIASSLIGFWDADIASGALESMCDQTAGQLRKSKSIVNPQSEDDTQTDNS